MHYLYVVNLLCTITQDVEIYFHPLISGFKGAPKLVCGKSRVCEYCTILSPILNVILKAKIVALYFALLFELGHPNLIAFYIISLIGGMMTHPIHEPFLLCELIEYTVQTSGFVPCVNSLIYALLTP